MWTRILSTLLLTCFAPIALLSIGGVSILDELGAGAMSTFPRDRYHLPFYPPGRFPLYSTTPFSIFPLPTTLDFVHFGEKNRA